MPRARTPQEKAELTARTEHDPGRYADRAKPTVDQIGLPYKRMSEPEKEYWQQISEEIPWLSKSDRLQLKMLCKLVAQYDDDPTEFPFNKLNMIRQILNSFGGSPSDRTKVDVPKDDEEVDPADKSVV